MTLLITREQLTARAAVVGAALPNLLQSLADDLRDAMRHDLVVPEEKAKLTRKGGRCPDDGAMLDFDPFLPQEHRCPRCGRIYDDDDHYRWWVMSSQLFLAERAVHGALLHGLTGDTRFAEMSEDLLASFARMYLSYPNSDNVLGPSRPFFSTYLESIWLLQLCVALDFLELNERGKSVGQQLREVLIEPSSRLIASYDEGGSNRQAWNSAALLASARVLNDAAAFKRHAARAEQLMQQSLLPDGSWYEGENYHLFAHRGLWYVVELCAAAGQHLPPDLVARYGRGFVSPFRTALPDLTLLARRDSQHNVTLQQWRFAELCELGIAGNFGSATDETLVSILNEIYSDAVLPGETGRSRSTAEVERNLPAARLSRADLGWKSLLCARPALPAAGANAPGWKQSTLLESQGIAVFRRESGRVMVALDYGHHGGGHGHPDRLNLNFHEGAARWLDDPGTGSYVDSSLFWYRSSLAHNAPLVAWRTQSREHGVLHGYDQQPDGSSGWAEAGFHDTNSAVAFNRTLVVLGSYFIDQLSWKGNAAQRVQLPLHVAAESVQLIGASTAATTDAISFTLMPPDQPAGDDAGLAFVSDRLVSELGAGSVLRVTSSFGDQTLVSWICLPHATRLWRMRAPGPPNQPTREFLVLDVESLTEGRTTVVHDWSASIIAVYQQGDLLTISHKNGIIHSHQRYSAGWQVLSSASAEQPIGFARRWSTGSMRTVAEHRQPMGIAGEAPLVIPVHSDPLAMGAAFTDSKALEFELGENHYRRSELDWSEHGKPSATVRMIADPDSLIVGVIVRKDDLNFAPARQQPYLDNEHPDVNSDGVQIHLAFPGNASAGTGDAAFLLVPHGSSLRVIPRAPQWKDALRESGWKIVKGGYSVAFRIDRASLPERGRSIFLADVIVNLLAPDRERRSGQLILSGSQGEWIYLMGDRQPIDRMLLLTIADE